MNHIVIKYAQNYGERFNESLRSIHPGSAATEISHFRLMLFPYSFFFVIFKKILGNMLFPSLIFQSLTYKNFIFLNPTVVITLNKISNNSSEPFYNKDHDQIFPIVSKIFVQIVYSNEDRIKVHSLYLVIVLS